MENESVSEAPSPEISDIMTDWVLIENMHRFDQPEISRPARERLLRRYGHAIRLYLHKALKGKPAAEEIYQNFVVKLCEGRYHLAAPDRGRFRKYLKAVLFNLVKDYYRHEQKFAPLPDDLAERSTYEGSRQIDDEEFTDVWRDQLLARAWEHLKECERKSPARPYATVLGQQVENPDLSRADIARFITARWQQPVSENWVARILHEARLLLQERIVHEVQLSLDHPTLDNIEMELGDLKLLRYCRRAITTRRDNQTPVMQSR